MRSNNNSAVHRVLNALSQEFGIFRVEIHEVMTRDVTQITFVHEDRGGVRIYATAEYDNDLLARSQDPVIDLAKFGAQVGEAFVDHLPENLVGKYALIRLWHDNHLNGTQPLFGNPNVEIPGWVFPKYKKSGRPEPGTTQRLSLTIMGDGGLDAPDPEDYTDRLAASILDKKLADQRDEMMKVAKNTTVSRKKKVVNRTPPLDMSKVKKPRCRDHQSEMKFNPVRGKWVCEYDGCKIVATPAKDEDDRSVTLGKGEVTLRVIATDDGKTTVLLISDDNIALNITNLVAVDDFVRSEGLLDTARDAVAASRDEFVEASPKYISIQTRVAVIGADALIDQHGK